MKTHSMKTLIIFILVLAVSTACSAANTDASSGLNSSAGTTWVLQSYGPENSQSTALADRQVTLKFDFEQDTASGNGGCNSYSGSFSLTGDKLSFGPMMSTLMACFPEEVMQQETTFNRLLSQVERYQLNQDTLVLYTADGQELTFTASAAP